MFQDSSISNYKEGICETSYNILGEISNDFLDQALSEVHLNDEDDFTHLSISYHDNTLNFNILSVQDNLGEFQKSIDVVPVILSKECQQTIQNECSNIPVKQLKMIRMSQEYTNSKSMNNEKSISSTTLSNKKTWQQITRSYIVVLILGYDIIILSFDMSSIINQNNVSHQMENMRILKIQFEGIITQIFINKDREQIIARVFQETSIKIILIDQIFNQYTIKDINQFFIDTERIVGSIAVSQEFAILRIITRLEKDQKRFFINTYHISQTGNIKIHFSKKPLKSLLNESNYNNCETLFSLSSSYLLIQDPSNIEVQDFNNNNVKNVIKEYNNTSKQQIEKTNSKNNKLSNHTFINKPQKTMYNLDKSTLIIANSSVNQYNPISVLEQINIFPSNQQQPIKRIIISQSISKQQAPWSAIDLNQTPNHFKLQKYANSILILVLLDDESKTMIPIMVDKDSLDQKVPELKYVSSQITNINNQDDSINMYNDFETNYFRTSKNVDIFKTPDRKASFNLINTLSLENNKLLFSSNNQFKNHNDNIIQHHLNSQSRNQSSVNSIFYPKGSCQRNGLSFDLQNSHEKYEKHFSQESNSSRIFSGYKQIIYNPIRNNNRTLFNENNNSVNVQETVMPTISKYNQKNDKHAHLNNEKNWCQLISPKQQKIQDFQDNNGYNIHKHNLNNLEFSSSFALQINQQICNNSNPQSMRNNNFCRQKSKPFSNDFNFLKMQTEKITKKDNDHTICNQINPEKKNQQIPHQQSFKTSSVIHSLSSIANRRFFQHENSKFNNKTNQDLNMMKSNCNKVENNDVQTPIIISNQINNDVEIEEFSTISCKKSQQMRNNIFNKNNMINTPPQQEKINSTSNSSFKQKLTDQFLTASSSSQISTIKQFSFSNPQNNIFSTSPLIQSPNNFNKTFNPVTEIKPFNIQTQTQLLQNCNNKFSHIDSNNNTQILQNQTFEIEQSQFYHERLQKQNKMNQQQLNISQDDQTILLRKRRTPYSYNNQQSPAYQINSEPIKILHKSD